MLSRRGFLGSMAAAPFLLRGAPLLRWVPGAADRLLVVLELEGGNDGLNTLIPLADPVYARLRPRLSVVRRGAHDVGAGFGLHPSLGGLFRLWRDGLACAVHAVGYAEPDRSHFRSRDIWHAADPSLLKVAAGTTGWLGRAADLLVTQGAALPAAAIGGQHVPLLLHGRQAVVPLLQRVEDYQLAVTGGGPAAREGLLGVVGGSAGGGEPGDLRADLAALAAEAAAGAERLRQQLARYQPKAEYPATPLGRHLQLVARMAVAGTGARLFHLAHGGFDTHARQLPAHAGLLQQLGDGLQAFVDDLRGHGLLDRALILVHSEFGRRVAENQSQGTDHGAAAPVFLIGGPVEPGLHGTPPDLAHLQEGDVAASTDFRRVYADLLRWAALPPAAVLGAEHQSTGALRA